MVVFCLWLLSWKSNFMKDLTDLFVNTDGTAKPQISRKRQLFRKKIAPEIQRELDARILSKRKAALHERMAAINEKKTNLGPAFQQILAITESYCIRCGSRQRIATTLLNNCPHNRLQVNAAVPATGRKAGLPLVERVTKIEVYWCLECKEEQ